MMRGLQWNGALLNVHKYTTDTESKGHYMIRTNEHKTRASVGHVIHWTDIFCVFCWCTKLLQSIALFMSSKTHVTLWLICKTLTTTISSHQRKTVEDVKSNLLDYIINSDLHRISFRFLKFILGLKIPIP